MVENPKSPPESRLHILVVEDSELLRQIFDSTLGKTYVVETAPDIKRGWEKIEKQSFDIVFLDIGLPDGNGHDLAYKIKRRRPETFVVMATASDFSDDKEEAWLNRVDGFITKPFGKDKIDDVIEHYWSRQKKNPGRAPWKF